MNDVIHPNSYKLAFLKTFDVRRQSTLHLMLNLRSSFCIALRPGAGLCIPKKNSYTGGVIGKPLTQCPV